MKVTLVFPCIRNFGGWNSLGVHPESCFISHGLPSIAACLEKRGHTVTLLDLREMSGFDDVGRWVHSHDSDIYGINMPTLDYHDAKETARVIKEVRPDSKVVVGGPHPSICPEIVCQDKVFDYVFVGEGEITFPDLVEDLDVYPRIVIGKRPDLDKLPYEKREIFNMEKVLRAPHPLFHQPFLNIISGRGCLFNCSFCKPGEDLIFGRFKMRSIEHLIGEIKLIDQKYNYATLMIDDDSFTLEPDYVMNFCEAYKKINKPFVCQSRADFICNHEDVLRRMREVGLYMLLIGFESGNQRILNLLRKGTTVEQNYEAAEICHRLGIKIFGNYMLGIPTETKEEMMNTLKMIRKIKPEHPSLSFFTPIVGTDLYKYCKENNLIISEDPSVLGTRSPTQAKIKGIDYEWIYRQLYRRNMISMAYGLIKKWIVWS